MLPTMLIGLATWVVLSVPAALLFGRFMAVGSASELLEPAFNEHQAHDVSKAA